MKLFYSKQYADCFEVLRSCEKMAESAHSAEHKVYVHYLYAEFHFKLRQFEESLRHYQLSR